MGDGKRALITGVTGQDGSYLAELLLEKGYEVWGTVRRTSGENTHRIEHLFEGQHAPRFKLTHCDLADGAAIHKVMTAVRPHELYNLGAQSHVQVSFDIPVYTGDVTGLGTTRLLEAIRTLEIGTRFYQASSSELYGKVVETPQNEDTPFYPRSPYAVAKAYANFITRNYREAYGMFAVNGVLFNHESPRRGENFVTRKISLAAARISLGLQERLSLGNLDARRDWGYAADYVEAMWMMLQADEPRDYVVATGETHPVREFCDHAFRRVGLPLAWEGEGVDEKGIAEDGRVLVDVNPEFFRPAEVDLLLGDTTRVETDLGWKPKVKFAQLVELMVDADLELARAEAGSS